MLDDVTFTAMGGEILGIAGIAGSGQKELLESHFRPAEAGGRQQNYIHRAGRNRMCCSTAWTRSISSARASLLSFVPEDRFGMGLVGGMNIIQNIMLRTYLARQGPAAPTASSRRDLSQKIVDDLEVVTPDINRTPIRRLSGGNVQKVLVGREIAQNPAVLDDGLRRARSGHQHVLRHLQSADRAEDEGRQCHLSSARIWTFCWSCATAFSFCAAARFPASSTAARPRRTPSA